MDLGHWTTSEKIPDAPYGFIYLITNNVNNRMYVGKKQILTNRKRQPLKGKTKKRSNIVETDWRTYTSSSNELNADIAKYGKSQFSFEILRFCCSKSELAFFEAKEQFARDVLLTENYYNGIINCRIGRIKLSKNS
tara:strand:+ start:142 stop:549 length:408 start_codon:yes stop_codon:yes gene_type:complete